MKPTLLSLLTGLIVAACSAPERSTEWTPLLDETLSQWQPYLSYRHQEDYTGKLPVDSLGAVISPIGFSDEFGVFTTVKEKDELILRVSGEVYGCLITRHEFENYHLKLKVKWGQKKWIPRQAKLKDSGLLYHSIGESGVDYWRSWMLSQEFQIMEGHMGDYWNISRSAIDIRAIQPEDMIDPIASTRKPFLPFGTGSKNGSFCLRAEDWESADGEWTTLELICFADKSIHIINGHVVMVLQNSRFVKEDGSVLPLNRGNLQLQSEAAEVFFKDIQIRKLDQLPEEVVGFY